MFKRAIFSQSRQIAAAARIPAARVVVPTTANTPARRWYSEEAKKEEATEKKEGTPKVSEEIEECNKQLEEKTKEAKDYKDKFTRAVADFRNLQDRTEREKKAAKDFAIQKFAKDLVESVDNFERALNAVPEIEKSANKELVDFYAGVKMTEEIFLSTLKKHGLEKINPMGEPFDPNKHEATFQVPMPDKEPNTVFHVQQTGFLLNGRTIRAAKVGVTSAAK
ncbi:GrpE-domain-containing protein [Pyronema domesticum]|uniref:GrpE protein homolog n=1 Tax=Pyronema omphalodes (strain CBS 100304) TaxID=1076935 RepID=U4LKJ1_PYROM|nr:GrpE-domain-containing protein [Pyronema domesticum]CCX32097.1 Similar to GrpE protein homolog, mitochondrial; acc. no. Q9P5U4 [Pyronema omphalodes CBS 100304]